jgi:Helicase conserved C-terminal domain
MPLSLTDKERELLCQRASELDAEFERESSRASTYHTQLLEVQSTLNREQLAHGQTTQDRDKQVEERTRARRESCGIRKLWRVEIRKLWRVAHPLCIGVSGRGWEVPETPPRDRRHDPMQVPEPAELSTGRQTIAFVAGVQQAHALANVLGGYGVAAAAVDGSMKPEERAAVLQDFRSGRVRVVTNAMLWTEGFDAPETGCVALVRPTRSRSLLVQMIGRGTRLAPDKSSCLVLDFVPGTVANLRLAGPADALAEGEFVRGRTGARLSPQPRPGAALRPSGEGA